MGSTGTNSTTCSATMAAFEYAAMSATGGDDLFAVVRQIQEHQYFLVAGHAIASIAECDRGSSAGLRPQPPVMGREQAELRRRQGFRPQLRIDAAGLDFLAASASPSSRCAGSCGDARTRPSPAIRSAPSSPMSNRGCGARPHPHDRRPDLGPRLKCAGSHVEQALRPRRRPRASRSGVRSPCRRAPRPCDPRPPFAA